MNPTQDTTAGGRAAESTAGRALEPLRDPVSPAGIGVPIGAAFSASRDALARVLLGLGVRPNHCTAAGFLLTGGAGVCLAMGAGHVSPLGGRPEGVAESYWPLAAGVLVFLASAADMLDGTLARLGNLRTRFGALLDSTLDRFSDMAIFLGCMWYFARTGNLTCTILAAVGLCNWVLISYVKARAEDLIPDCGVGFWVRGERMAAVLIAAFSSHVPTLLWQQAIFPAFTVWRRVDYARRWIRADEHGGPMPPRGPLNGALRYLAPWRFPRGSLPYDLVTGTHIAFLVFGPMIWPALYGTADPFRAWIS